MSLVDKLGGVVDPHELVDYLIENKVYLPKAVREKLQLNFSPVNVEKGEIVGGKEDLDLHAEVVEQFKAVRALRREAVGEDGVVNAGLRDAKDALSASTSSLSLLTKVQSDIYGADRVRTIQRVTLDLLKKMDPTLQEQFISNLEKELGVADV